MKDYSQRNQEIVAAVQRNEPVNDIAKRHGLSAAHVYRLAREARQKPEHFQNEPTGRSGVRAPLFREMGMSGLRRYGGEIDEDYDKDFKPLTRKLARYKEMSNDPIVAAVLQAIRMQIRRSAWYVDPGGSEDVDQEAAEWLETCMNDMSQSWADCVDQSLTMMRDGFSLCELIYKRRIGLTANVNSKYDDGRIGWRKWLFIGSDSLAPGSPWIFDENGGLQGYNQQPPPSYQTRAIPIDKSILFRTTIDKNNPEGQSILRPMYPAYYMKRNLEEIEGITAERMGAGFPVIYAGSDTTKNPDDPDSDAAHLMDAVRNVRVDEQMGLYIPFAKMGSGAAEGEGVLFELVAPPGRGVIDFNQTITRYETRMTMVGLAQFIHLGMNQVGSRSLGESAQDFFMLALDGWLDSIEETIHRFGTERLFKLNLWPGLTDYPRIKHKAVQRAPLAEIADYISKLANVGIIIPEPELENTIRELADLPLRVVEVEAPEVEEPDVEEPEEEEPAEEEKVDQPEETPEEEAGYSSVIETLRSAIHALHEETLHDEQRAQFETLSESLRQRAEPPQIHVSVPAATQTFNITTPPAPNVEVTNQVQPTPIDVHSVVNVPESQVSAPTVTVNVEPPNVEIINQVQPTPIEITNEVTTPTPEVTVNLPEQSAPPRTMKVERDVDGNLTGARIESEGE